STAGRDHHPAASTFVEGLGCAIASVDEGRPLYLAGELFQVVCKVLTRGTSATGEIGRAGVTGRLVARISLPLFPFLESFLEVLIGLALPADRVIGNASILIPSGEQTEKCNSGRYAADEAERNPKPIQAKSKRRQNRQERRQQCQRGCKAGQ